MPIKTRVQNNKKKFQHRVWVDSKVRKYVIDTKKASRILEKLLNHIQLGACEVNLFFISPRLMRTYNKEFRGKDRSTDVLSFPQISWNKPLNLHPQNRQIKSTKNRNKMNAKTYPILDHLHPFVLGDILICVKNAESNAFDIGQSIDKEICFLMVHGLLHLCGHDHMNQVEEKAMIKQQKLAMALLKKNDWTQLVKEKKHAEAPN